MPIRHDKVSAKVDSGDATLIQPSDWNEDHVGGIEVSDGATSVTDVSIIVFSGTTVTDMTGGEVVVGAGTGFASDLVVIFDGGGAPIPVGYQVDFGPFGFTGEITLATLLGSPTGSIAIDIWKDDYASYPPTNSDSITNVTPPEIITGIKSSDNVLDDWDTLIEVGDILRFNVDSVTDIEHATLTLRIVRI